MLVIDQILLYDSIKELAKFVFTSPRVNPQNMVQIKQITCCPSPTDPKSIMVLYGRTLLSQSNC
jgi:hypothetical protein